MQRQRLKFLTSVGVTPQPLHDKQQQQELQRKRQHLRSILSEDFVDLPALRAAIFDGALHAGPEREDSRGEAEAEDRDGDARKETSEVDVLRAQSWKLLLEVLPVHRKSWGFCARQHREWYAELHTAAESFSKGGSWGWCRSPACSTSSLRFTFHDMGGGDVLKDELFSGAARLMLALDVKHLVSSLPTHDTLFSPASADNFDTRLMPLTASALPTGELNIGRSRGQSLALTAEQKTEWRVETFDMAVIAVVLIKALGGAREHEAFWCLQHFAAQHAQAGAVFALMDALEALLCSRDPELVQHLRALGLSFSGSRMNLSLPLFSSLPPPPFSPHLPHPFTSLTHILSTCGRYLELLDAHSLCLGAPQLPSPADLGSDVEHWAGLRCGGGRGADRAAPPPPARLQRQGPDPRAAAGACACCLLLVDNTYTYCLLAG